MDFGLFLQPLHHPSSNPTDALEQDLELVVLLDELGYSEAWIGEHHSSGWENVAAPDAFIAAAAERTSQIMLGTGVLQLGLHHPLVALDRMIFLGRAPLDRAIAEYVSHYHDERAHQGLGNELVSGAPPQREGDIETDERLGGLLRYYHRVAA